MSSEIDKLAAVALRKEAAAIRAAVPTVSAPKLPSVPKPKTVAALDPRTDKPAGMNLVHGIQTVSNGADTGASYSSFARRVQGSPT